MLIACWSPKGGAGTTVVSTALGLLLARSLDGGARVADLAGDVPAVLGLPEPDGPGLADWLAAPGVGGDALAGLEVPAADALRVLPLGTCGPAGRPAPVPGRADDLVAALSADERPTVADCGTLAEGPQVSVAAGAARSVLVLRPCYLALRRALAAPVRPSGIVLVDEPGRALGRRDVEDVLGVPVCAELGLDPAVARAVDAGLLTTRLPRAFERALRDAA